MTDSFSKFKICITQADPTSFGQMPKNIRTKSLPPFFRRKKTPVFVAVDETEAVLGYAFCMLTQNTESHILTDIRSLYIDDLCVDETCRGRHIGTALYDYVLAYAKKAGCYNVTLNVWSCNPAALRFYEKCGLTPQKIGMEKIL